MRIVIAAGIFPPDIGGPATYAAALSEFCIAHDSAVSVICFSDTSGIDISRGYTVYRVSRASSKILGHLRYFWLLLRLSRSADLVYAQGPIAGGLQACIVSMLTRKKYAVKVTGDYAWEQAAGRYDYRRSIDTFQKEKGGLPYIIRSIRWLQCATSRRAEKVIVPSNYLGTMVQGWGVRPSQVAVIYNAVRRPESFDVTKEIMRERLGILGRPIISVGRLVSWKGFDCLIDIWKAIMEKIPDAQLYIVGDGPDRSRLSALIDSKGLSQAVSLVGKKSEDELAQWYHAADIFVLNSGYEGLSHTILEAMSYKIPCAVSDSGGNPELIKHEKTGLLFGYNDRDGIIKSLIRLMTQSDEAERFAQAAGSWIDQRTHQTMFRDTLAVLQTLIPTSRSTRRP